MNSKFSRIIDFFLLKKDFYSKLTDKSMWLYIGIALLGIRDVVFAVLGMNYSDAETKSAVHYDIKIVAMLFVTALVIGLVDAISFSYPVFDIIKHFKKRNESNSMSLGMLYSSLLTKVIKVYIIVNIILTPLDLLSYFTGSYGISSQSITFMYISSILGILGYFWFNGAITRGLCVLFKLPDSVRGLVFVLAFVWNALLSSAIGYLLNYVLIHLW